MPREPGEGAEVVAIPPHRRHPPREYHLVACSGCGSPVGAKGSMPAVRVIGRGRTALYAHSTDQCMERARAKPKRNVLVPTVGRW